MDPQRPVRRWNAPTGSHDRDAHGARLCRHARAPCGRRRLRARKPASRLAHALGGGRDHPSDPARRDHARVSRLPDAEPRRASRRPPRAARGEPTRRAARRRALRAARPRPGHGRDGRAPRLLGTGGPRSDSRPPGRPLRGRRRARDADRPARHPCRGDRRGRLDRHRLRRHRTPVRRQPELPARRHALRLLLRRALPHRPRPPGVGRRLRSRDRARSRGLPRQRALAGRRRCREHRDVEPDHRRRLRRVLQGRPRARTGAGDDEQHGSRNRTASRTTRRSAAARAPARPRTGRRACMSRCRTPSTRRPRRSSSRTRSASSATSCVADRAEPGCTAAETASSASSASSSRAASPSCPSAARWHRAAPEVARTASLGGTS